MSYARFGPDSDVYVFADIDGGYRCCFCAFSRSGPSFRCDTAAEMIEHLREHRAAGHTVPEDAIEELQGEVG